MARKQIKHISESEPRKMCDLNRDKFTEEIIMIILQQVKGLFLNIGI